ncbi:MAG: DUF1850 domain-containing protein [Synergistales bacterium]|nr:DUF1850 domain-containing protein [Synergistales bacterium]
MFNALLKRLLISMILLASLFIFLAPVQNLVILQEKEDIFSLPVRIGQKIKTGYIHSVQLTPVEDDYKVVDNLLWLWEERVISHNAGLPTEAPRNGTFFQDDQWMYIRGGRYNWPSFNLRVGNGLLGKNWLSLGKSDPNFLYETFPGKRLTFQISEEILFFSILNSNNRLLQKGE